MKKNLKLVAILIFLVFFIFNFLQVGLNMYNNYQQIDFEEEIRTELNLTSTQEIDNSIILEYKNKAITSLIFITFIFSIIISLFEPMLLWIILIAIYLSRKKYLKLKLTKTDFSKNKFYYRDILKNYSVSVLSYLDTFTFNYPNYLVGVLLELENKKLIGISENSIAVLNSSDQLNESTKYILNNIKDNRLTINKNEYEKLVINDSINKGLLKEGIVTKKVLIKEIIVSAIAYTLFNVFFVILINNINKLNFSNNIFLILTLFLVIFIFMIVLLYYPITKIISLIILTKKLKNNNNIRTEKGEEINLKLEGLKKFLEDFSLLDEKDKEELIIWEDYLIYSIIFNQNKKIVEKYKSLININF